MHQIAPFYFYLKKIKKLHPHATTPASVALDNLNSPPPPLLIQILDLSLRWYIWLLA